jgi:O-antigen/teichoic acid export membrane protein
MTAAPARILRALAADLGKAHLPAKLGDLTLSFVSMALFSRLYAPEDYTLYTLILAALTTLHALGVSWVHLTALRYWRDPSPPSSGTARGSSSTDADAFLSSLNVALFAALALCLALWGWGNQLFLPDLDNTSVGIGLALLCTFTLNQHTVTRTRAMRELNLFVLLSLLPRPLMIACGLFAAWRGYAQPTTLLLAWTVGYGASVLLEALLNGRRYWPKRFAFRQKDLALLLSDGAPVALVAASNVVLTVSDRFLIAHFYGTQAAGEYTIAHSLISKADSLTMFVGAAAFPLLVDRFEAHGPDQTARDLSRLITTFCAAYLPLTIGLALIAKPACNLLIGSQYSSAPTTMVALAPAVFAIGVLRYLIRPFQLAARPGPQLVLTASSGLLTIALNFFLIARFGPLGAAWGSTIGTILCVIGHYLWAQRILPYSLEWPELGKITLATLGMAASTLATLALPLASWLSLALSTTAGAVTYLLLAYTLNIANTRSHVQKLLQGELP